MRTFSNLAISLDGRIADHSQPAKALGTPLDRQTMQVIRKMADVILVGSNTLKAHPVTMKVRGKKLSASSKQPANAIVSARADFDPKWDFWKDPEVVRLVFTTQESLPKAVELCADRALVFAVGHSGHIDVKKIFEKLKALHFKNVLVEGGGAFMASVMAEKLLQELYVTLTPWVLGGSPNPSLVMGEEALWQKLDLLKSKKIKNEVYLHYRVKGALRV
jgi:5-amino-6-(5-phosphoribosylamino)uracil reductase